MAHGIYDERGTLLASTESDANAFVVARRRQMAGEKLTTVLFNGTDEVVFIPHTPGFKRAPSAIEQQHKSYSEVHYGERPEESDAEIHAGALRSDPYSEVAREVGKAAEDDPRSVGKSRLLAAPYKSSNPIPLSVIEQLRASLEHHGSHVTVPRELIQTALTVLKGLSERLEYD